MIILFVCGFKNPEFNYTLLYNLCELFGELVVIPIFVDEEFNYFLKVNESAAVPGLFNLKNNVLSLLSHPTTDCIPDLSILILTLCSSMRTERFRNMIRVHKRERSG